MHTSTPSPGGLDTIVEPPGLPPRLPAREKKVNLKDKKDAEGSSAHGPQTITQTRTLNQKNRTKNKILKQKSKKLKTNNQNHSL
jgi:hypothetical protein